MSEQIKAALDQIHREVGSDRPQLLEILREVQRRFGGVSSEVVDLIAQRLQIPRVEVESVVSFYAFLSDKPNGKVVIRLCNDIIDRMHGSETVARAFESELGIKMGQTTADGKISLAHTPCIGMCDQAPAALVNDVVVTHLSSDTARSIVSELRENSDPKQLVRELGNGNNAHDLVSSMVQNNSRQRGPVLLAEFEPGAALHQALAMSPVEVIRNVKTARLRGRGGAGFPTGMKWEFTRATKADKRYIICNADEGEPGTFKDRVLLTEYPDLLFEGMTIGGYAIGAQEGIVYLRGEYAYLRKFLESVLERRREEGLLGKNICGVEDLEFDIRIQMGAGAYICGEETALISSCEGLRGDPKNRPPFPAQSGYLGYPSSVNNVETFCCAARIMEHGPGWFSSHGTDRSAGTKLLSVSGDCKRPGIYEVSLSTSLTEILELVGAEDAQALQVGGPSGQMVGPEEFNKTICYDDFPTGGSMMVFGPQRNLLEVVLAFLEFFVEESCGYCTPCRVGNFLLKQGIRKILDGKGEPADLEYLEELAQTVKMASRCGLGQTSPNPVLSTLQRFRGEYERLVEPAQDGRQPGFDLSEAVASAASIVGRESTHS